MRLYKQELLRIIKATRTRVIFVITIILSVLFAVLPLEFCDVNYLDDQGNTISLHGAPALDYLKNSSKKGIGEATVEELKQALEKYQQLYDEYGVDPLGELPLDIYWEKVQPIRPLFRMLMQTYGAINDYVDQNTISLQKMDPETLDSFYSDCQDRLVKVMQSDDLLNKSNIIEKAQSIYSNVDTPFYIYNVYSRDAFDFISFCLLFLVLLSSVLVAPVFSERYHSGEDSVLRCTFYGNHRLVRTTTLAYLTVVTVLYFLGIGLHLLTSDLIFGVDALRESTQVLYTVYSLPNTNLLEMQLILAITGWISCIAVTSLSLSISALSRESSTSMVLSLLIVFMPTLVYSVAGGVSWILALFPSASVGLSNNMMQSLVDLRFLTLGDRVFWYPAVLVVIPLAELVVFWFSACIFYMSHQVTQ